MSSPAPRVFCHECRQESTPVRGGEPLCAICRGSFVEELSSTSDSDPSQDPRLWSAEAREEPEAMQTGGNWDDVRLGAGHPMGQLMQILGFAPNVGHTDDAWDEPNPFAEADVGHDGRPRETTAAPSPQPPPPPPQPQPQTRNADSSSFLRSLFGMRGSDDQPAQNQQNPQAANAPPNRTDQGGRRMFSRTFNNGQGHFSFTVGTAPPFVPPRGSGGDAQQEQGESMPISTLASFLQQAFGTPPPTNAGTRPEPPRQASDPASNHDTTHQGEQQRSEGAGAGQPFNYLINILNQLGARPPGAGGNPGNYVWSEEAMTDIMSQLMAQAGGNAGPPPASDEVISKLTRVKMTKEMMSAPTISDCAVCKEELQEHEDCIILPCKHIFHSEECLLPWLKRNGTCPVCRFSLVENHHSNRDPDETIPTSSSNTSTFPTPPPLRPRPFTRSSVHDRRPSSTTSPTNASLHSPSIEGSSVPEGWFQLPLPFFERRTSSMTNNNNNNSGGTSELTARERAAMAALRRQERQESLNAQGNNDVEQGHQPMDLD